MLRRAGFTLIELLVVIAIVAVVAVAVLLALNPAQLVKQARDAGRMTDMALLVKALGYAQASGVASSAASTTVYVSVPDSSATCANLVLPGLPSGWSYACKGTSTYRAVDGTGWIPVDFTRAGNPFASVPVDAENAPANLTYYTYVADANGYAVSARLLSAKYAPRAKADGGSDPVRLEIGSRLALAAQQYGLVGWWPFDEGTGTQTADASGNGYDGTLNNGPVWASGASCRSGSCLTFAGATENVSIGSAPAVLPDAYTVAGWARLTSNNTEIGLFGWSPSAYHPGFHLRWGGARPLLYREASNFRYFSSSLPTPIYDNGWHYIVVTVAGNGSADVQTSAMYVDGQAQVVESTYEASAPSAKVNFTIGRAGFASFYGALDDFRLYNRALSAAEVGALYATQ